MPLRSLSTSRLPRAFASLAFGCALLASSLFSAATATAQILSKDLPSAIKGLDIVEHLGQPIPLDLEFTDSLGRKTKLSAFFNDTGKKARKPVVLALVYYRCPMQCQTILHKLNDRFNQLDLSIGDDFNVAVVSFDPSESRDAAAKVKEEQFILYTRPHPKNLDDSWRFMTSDQTAARTLADSVGFPYRYLPDSNEYSHGTVLFVLTPEGKISRYLYGIDYPADQLKLALLEASGGKIGTTVDRVLLWCFHYDPTAGAYTLQAVFVMRVGGAIIVTLLSVLLGALWYADRRKRTRGTRSVSAERHPVSIQPVSVLFASDGHPGPAAKSP